MKLFPYQVEGVDRMLHFLAQRKAVYLGDEMGLGKTAQALTVLNAVNPNQTLIVCPSVMKYTWADEIYLWCPTAKVGEVKVVETSKDLSDLTARYLIVSYDMVSRHVSKFHSCDLLILDEAHYLKNTGAKRTAAVLGVLWPKCLYKVCLSGTPFLASVADGFPLFNRMCPELFPSFDTFVKEYTFVSEFPIRTRFGMKWVSKFHGVKNAEVLSKLIRSKFFVRRRKDEVLKDLPPKIWSRIALSHEYTVTVPKGENEVLAASVKALKQAIETGAAPENVPSSLAGLRQEQAIKKLPAIIEFATNLLDQDIPLVVFFFHREVIRQFETALQKYNPYVITGDTTPKDRASQVKAFQAGGERNLFILQLQAGGVGITLTRSSTVLLGEISYSPGEVNQAVARCHRIGSEGSAVNIYYFVPNGSIDEDIEEVVIRKAEEFTEVLN